MAKKLKTYYIDENIVSQFDYLCNKQNWQKGKMAEMSLKMFINM